MSRLYREITGIWSKRGRLTLITGVVMIMLVLQACGNNTGAAAQQQAVEVTIPLKRLAIRLQAMFRPC